VTIVALDAHPALRVASTDALHTLEAGGVDVVWDAELAGVERCFVRDPWGNRLELLA
jgi:hypothetical protein